MLRINFPCYRVMHLPLFFCFLAGGGADLLGEHEVSENDNTLSHYPSLYVAIIYCCTDHRRKHTFSITQQCFMQYKSLLKQLLLRIVRNCCSTSSLSPITIFLHSMMFVLVLRYAEFCCTEFFVVLNFGLRLKEGFHKS